MTDLPETAELIATRVYLRPLGGEMLKKRMPDWLGVAAQQLFLNTLGSQTEMQAALHDDDGEPRPYTASTLLPIDALKGRRWRMEKEYYLRFTTLNQAASEAFLYALTLGGALAPGSEVEFHRSVFRVSHVDLRSHNDVGWLNYADLLKRFKEPLKDEEEIELRFSSETAFALVGSDLAYPLPEASRVFGGLLRKWNVFCPQAARLQPLEERDLDRDVALSEFEIRSGLVNLETGGETGGHQIQRKGFKGRVVYKLYGSNEELRRTVKALADYAFFAGVGIETTRGMGQAHKHYARL